MNLSARQIELLRTTFALLEPKARVAALAYYQRLFALNPTLLLQSERELETESERLLKLLQEATALADRPQQLRALLARPGGGCASYDAGGRNHDVAGEALLWSLSTTLGREFTPEARTAWAGLHAMVGEFRRDQARPSA